MRIRSFAILLSLAAPVEALATNPIFGVENINVTAGGGPGTSGGAPPAPPGLPGGGACFKATLLLGFAQSALNDMYDRQDTFGCNDEIHATPSVPPTPVPNGPNGTPPSPVASGPTVAVARAIACRAIGSLIESQQTRVLQLAAARNHACGTTNPSTQQWTIVPDMIDKVDAIDVAPES